MTKAVLIPFHNYVPMYDHKYFDVIYDYFMYNFNEIWGDEVDKLYLIDSNWNIKDSNNPKVEILKVNSSLRYYDAYKEVLPQVKEDLVLFLDNDMVIYRKCKIAKIFGILEGKYEKKNYIRNVVSIYDTIGEKKFKELGGQSKFCPYLFASITGLLKRYLDCEWGPVPWGETLSELTLNMLKDGIRPYEMEEDKNSIYFDEVKDKPKDLGYYHIRAGSTPAFLLTHRNLGNRKTYDDYIKNQPKREVLRQLAWYWIMCDWVNDGSILIEMVKMLEQDLGIKQNEWEDYIKKFTGFHGL